jgi:hypothetical protein
MWGRFEQTKQLLVIVKIQIQIIPLISLQNMTFRVCYKELIKFCENQINNENILNI